MGIEDEVLGTLNLLQMDLGVPEGQIRGDYFLDSIFDPSVNQCSGSPVQTSAKIPRNLLWPVYTNLGKDKWRWKQNWKVNTN